MSTRPNILWICTDQQRYDTISALGQAHIRTPNIDRLVRSGVSFRRAYAQSPICTPSRASFMTGRYPSSTRVFRNGTAEFPPTETLASKVFATHGYDTGLVGKLHLSAAQKLEQRPDDGYRMFQWSQNPFPIDRPEHAYEVWLREEKKVDPVALYADTARFAGAGVPAELHQSTWCAEVACRFIAEPREKPFMLSVHPFDPHPPFDPAPEYLDRIDIDALPPPAFRPSDIANQKLFADVALQTPEALDVFGPRVPKSAGTKSPRPSQVPHDPPESFDGRQVKAAYYAEIELLDDCIGRILDTLEETGQRENTIVLFHSDHGEMLGDHGLVYKGCRFFDPLVRVPLIFSAPGRFLADRQSDALVELVDLVPTLFEAAGLPVGERIEGRSLLALLEGRAGLDRHKDHVVSEYNDSVSHLPPTHGSMYFDGRYKSAIYRGHPVDELYDLDEDPDEFDNLALRPDRIALRHEVLRRHMDALLERGGDAIARSDVA